MSPQDPIQNPTVLAQVPDSPEFNPRWSPNYKQRIVEFYGFEGEDFRHFRALLESFFAVNGITQDHRKVIILKAQLRRAASIFFSGDMKSKNLMIDKITYDEAITLLQERFLSKDLLEEYEYAFQSMKQNHNESPQMFLSRLHEAADLADIEEDKLIYSRFRAGLLPQIIVFCKEQSASTHKDWVKNSNAWWSAHASRQINLVDNPFVSAGSYFNGNNELKFNSVKTRNDTIVSVTDNKINDNHKSSAEAYANITSPTIANLTAKLEALELNSLIPSTGSIGKINNEISHTPSIKSLMSDNDFKSFIKNIVQEVNNEKVNSYMPYKNNRKPQYNNENYSNDQNYQNNYQKNNRKNFNSYYDNQQQSHQDNLRTNIPNGHQSQNFNRNNYNNSYPRNQNYNNYPPQQQQHGHSENNNYNQNNQQRHNNSYQPQNNYRNSNRQEDNTNNNQKN